MKKKYVYLIILAIGLFLLLVNHYCWSYSRRIGDTRFYLVETMANSKEGKPLACLYYMPTDNSMYIGEYTSGFPKIILWNDRYIISKNFDGNEFEIIEYVIINLDSINPDSGVMKDIHRFQDKKAYYNYLKQIKLSEADMNQTDNHISWWEMLFE